MFTGNDSTPQWQTVTMDGEIFASIEDLQLKSNQEYQVQLKVTNMAGFTGAVISETFTVETESPSANNGLYIYLRH